MTENIPRGRAARETLAIPERIRAGVDERDGHICRVCGKYLGDQRALHHILYGGTARGMGGRRHHAIDEIITVCWAFAGNCHDVVHSRKTLYQPVLLQLAANTYPGLTALAILRWNAVANERSTVDVLRTDTTSNPR